jgi:TolA-binding protein
MPDAYMAMGMIFEEQQKPDSAILMYENLLDHNPDYQPAQAKLRELGESE